MELAGPVLVVRGLEWAAPCQQMRQVPLGSRAAGRRRLVVVAAVAAVVVAVVVAEGAAAVVAGAVALVVPAEPAVAGPLRRCWRYSVAFGGVFAAFSRPAAWIPLGTVVPPVAVVLLLVVVPLPGVPQCVAIGARLGAADPPVACRCPGAVGAPVVLLLSLQRVLPASSLPSAVVFVPLRPRPPVLVLLITSQPGLLSLSRLLAALHSW